MKRGITPVIIDRLRPKAREYHLWDRDQPGFGVRVRTSGHKSFIFKRRVDGRLINRTLGDAAKMPLVQARDAAARIQQELHGITWPDGPRDDDLHTALSDLRCLRHRDLLAVGAQPVEGRVDRGLGKLSAMPADADLRQAAAGRDHQPSYRGMV